MDKTLHILGFALAVIASTTLTNIAVGIPASPQPVIATQPDGTTFSMRLCGDEFMSWHETVDGYVIVKDSDGFWKYGRMSDRVTRIEPVSGGIVGKSDPAKLNITKQRGVPKELLRQQLLKRMGPTSTMIQRANSSSSLLAPGTLEPSFAPLPPAASGPVKIPVSGSTTVKNVVILACFSDHWDSANNRVLPAFGRINPGEYTNLFNEVGHTNDGAVGSVRDYYNEVSYGKLTVNSVVSNWVLLPNAEAYYGANSGGQDIRPDIMAADAIAAAEAAGFDFSQGDSDGDGWVDCLTIIHSGFGEEWTGNPATCIWSHQWNMQSVQTYDSKKMYRYHTEPALRGQQGVSTSIIRIGVICHEMGHFFGLPDLYDYSDLTWGLGAWCIMAYGSWNGGDGKRPAHFSAWCKCSLGFVVPEIVHSRSSLSLPRVEDSAKVHMIRDGTFNEEYFLIENRDNYGFDNDVAIFPGILIHHIDPKSRNNDLSTWPHPLVKIEEADGNDSLGSQTSMSQPTDVWNSGSGLPGGFQDVTGVLSSNAMMYQTSHPYNRGNNPAFYSYIRIPNFSASGTPMSYGLLTLRPTVETLTAGPPTPPFYNVQWSACTNAIQYEIQESSPTSLGSFFDGAENEEDIYANWSIGGTARRSAGGANTGTYSFAMEYGSSVQSLTMRNPFQLLSGTTVSFYVMSHIVTGFGYLTCQISNDGGVTWKTLGTYSGYIDPWTLYSYNTASITALGISVNDWCLLRFVSNTEYGFGWSSYPAYGFAVDDVSIVGTSVAGYGNWTTLSNNVPVTFYSVSGKPNGTYSYRVRALANGIWQGYGRTGDVIVVPVGLSKFSLE